MQLCVEFCFPPHFYQRKMTIFAPPFTKKSPAARLKMRLPPALTLVVGAARPESATRLVSIIPVSHEGVSLTREPKRPIYLRNHITCCSLIKSLR